MNHIPTYIEYVTFTYAMSKGNELTTNEITLPMTNIIAYLMESCKPEEFQDYDLVNGVRQVTNILENLAQLQGCSFEGITKIERKD